MNHYSKEFKESIIARMLPPNKVGVPDLARETGIPRDTLYAWRTKAGKVKTSVSSNIYGELSSEDKFSIVLETASLNETELSEYCRRKGLFPQQITVWQENCRQAHAPQSSKADKTTIKAQKSAIKRLEADLRRKEKALAEAAALLILQKKAHALWEGPEGEKSTKLSVVK